MLKLLRLSLCQSRLLWIITTISWLSKADLQLSRPDSIHPRWSSSTKPLSTTWRRWSAASVETIPCLTLRHLAQHRAPPAPTESVTTATSHSGRSRRTEQEWRDNFQTSGISTKIGYPVLVIARVWGWWWLFWSTGTGSWGSVTPEWARRRAYFGGCAGYLGAQTTVTIPG
jgi:hypothetical protein